MSLLAIDKISRTLLPANPDVLTTNVILEGAKKKDIVDDTISKLKEDVGNSIKELYTSTKQR